MEHWSAHAMIPLLAFLALLPQVIHLASCNTFNTEVATRSSRGWFSNSRGDFSPRMDYDEWRPLGRGDPLKNDPTYDYVPPVLERVHYWMDPSKRTPDPPLPNSGVLILGSSRTETPVSSTQTYKEEMAASSRIDTMSLLDPFLKLMDVSKFGFGTGQPATTYQRPTQPPSSPGYSRPPNFNKPVKIPALQRPPYTILMPPPPPPEAEQTATSFATSTTTTEAALSQEGVTPSSEAVTNTASQTTAVFGHTTHNANLTTSNPTVVASTENVYRPVAISMPEENLEPNDIRPTTKHRPPTLDDSSMVLPIVSMFSNHHRDHAHDVHEFTQNPTEEMHTHLDHLHHHHHLKGAPGENNIVALPQKAQRWEDGYKTDNGFRPTTLPPEKHSTTDTVMTFTTDPMFKHYKQPSKPVKGAFYLIIQGHSKVKTYGASKNPLNALVSSNEINESEEKPSNKEYYESESQEGKIRRGKKLNFVKSQADYILDDERAEIVEGHPMVELSASFEAEDQDGHTGFSVADKDYLYHHLEEAFGKSSGGNSKKRNLKKDAHNSRKRRSLRRLLAVEEVVGPPQLTAVLTTTTSTSHSSPTVTVSTTQDTELVSAFTGSVLSATSSQTTVPAGAKKRKNSTKRPHEDLDQQQLGLESLIAFNDDYNSEDIISLLLKEEGQGSGVGNFVGSLFGRSADPKEDM